MGSGTGMGTFTPIWGRNCNVNKLHNFPPSLAKHLNFLSGPRYLSHNFVACALEAVNNPTIQRVWKNIHVLGELQIRKIITPLLFTSEITSTQYVWLFLLSTGWDVNPSHGYPLWELSVLPKNITKRSRPGIEPGPLDPEASAQILWPPCLNIRPIWGIISP